jgi:heptosyltransferase II
MRILVNALSGIGDAIMFSPALALLKKHLPDSQIDMMVMFRQVEELYSTNPAIDNIFFIDFLKQPKLTSIKQVRALKKNKYDYSLNVYPSNRREYNVVQYLTGAKKRIAAKYLHEAGMNLDFLNTTLIPEVKNRHNVIENYELVKQIAPNATKEELGDYVINIPEGDTEFAARYFEENNLNDSFVVGFHAGSATFKGHINKRWSSYKYSELAKELNAKYNAQVILFGTEDDVNNSILKEIKGFGYKPKVNGIMQSLALMKQCNLFVSNDTALMHLASGLGVPQIAIFGYTNSRELHPWKNKHLIVRKELKCSPCFYNSPKPVKCIYEGDEEFKCIRTIMVSDVMEACEKLIEEIPRNIKP